MKKLLMLLFLSLILLVTPMCSPEAAKDSPSDWALEEIERADSLGLVTDKARTGYQDNISREEFAELVVRMYDKMSDSQTQTSPGPIFTDTDNPDVSRASELGIVKGVGDNKFNPDESISRQEISLMFYRALGLIDFGHQGLDLGKHSDKSLRFSDGDLVADWAEEAVKYMYNEGIIRGVGSNKLNPLGNTSKEQAIVLVYRTFLTYSDEIELGKTIDQVKSALGQPTDIVKSEYGFDWYLFAEDYDNYIQVGVEGERVVALYTLSEEYGFAKDYIASRKTDIRNEFGSPDEFILKGNIQYYYMSTDEVDYYNSGDNYMRFFYDEHESDTVYAMMVIDEDVELGLEGYHGELNEEVREGFEVQLFHLVNATRNNKGKQSLTWSEEASQAGYLHSKDMAENNYFSHQGLDGSDPRERMEEQDIRGRMYAENIAANQNAIFTHNSLFNSWGHRVNILGDTEYLGVGTYFIESGNYNIYHTQNFYR